MTATISLQDLHQWSGYLDRFRQQFPEKYQQCVDEVESPLSSNWIAQRYQSLADRYPQIGSPELASILRQLRREVFVRLILRDGLGYAQLEEVVDIMSTLADWCVQTTYATCARELADNHGIPYLSHGKPQEMLIIAMGKMGGKELNVSSDIDLIFLYNEEGETSGRRPISYQEFYQKLGQRIMRLLSDVDAEGFVFRTDLRLRPDGDSGPLAWSLPALERYFIEQGREWERYAWLKARSIPLQAFVGSDWSQQSNSYEKIRQPFVYRKYFDFDALQELRGLREQIRQDWNRKKNARMSNIPMDNIKLGEGGIREIEFIVQAEQLIRGGRQPALQERSLLAALAIQHQTQCIDETTYTLLVRAYRFLRKVEHLLQYREDEQTHLLPSDPEALNTLARLMSPEDPNTFLGQLKFLRQQVEQLFQSTFNTQEDRTEATPHTLNAVRLDESEQMQQVFGDDTASMMQRLEAFYRSAKIRGLGKKAQANIQRLMPQLLCVAGKTERATTAFPRLLDVIEAIGKRSAYLSLLVEYPDTLHRLARMLVASQWATHYLIQHPILLDELLDHQNLTTPIATQDFQTNLHIALAEARLADGSPDIERQMDCLREFQQLYIFHVLAQDLGGKLTVEQIGDQLSWLADTLLHHTLQTAWQDISGIATFPAGFAIIAYGKLGGKEMGYESDLDLVFLYDENSPHTVDILTRLVRKLCTWVQSLTPAGRLYELDLRLRPDGDAGLIVQTISGFQQYQMQKAWTWEHQALTRARWVAGDPALNLPFEALKTQLLTMVRTPHTLAQEVLEMRAKMIQNHRVNETPKQFDIKLDAGGMVDVEFVTQYLVLLYAREHPTLCKNLGNIALLSYAAQAGLAPFSITLAAVDAYRQFRKKQHQLRLQNVERTLVDPEQFTNERAAVLKLWQAVFSPYLETPPAAYP